MAVLKSVASMTFSDLMKSGAGPSQNTSVFLYKSAKEETNGISWQEMIDKSSAYQRKELFARKAAGWKTAIRDKGDGIEIDHTLLSFTKAESAAIRAAQNQDAIKKAVFEVFTAHKMLDAANKLITGERWTAVSLHDDTENIHLDIYQHRHYIDEENKTISVAKQGSSASLINAMSEEIKRKLIEAGIFNDIDLTTVAGFKKENDEALVKINEDIQNQGGFGTKIEDAKKLILSSDTEASIKNQDFILSQLTEKQKEIEKLQEILVISQQAAAALIQRDDALAAQAQAEKAAAIALEAQEQAQAAEAAAVEAAEKAAQELEQLKNEHMHLISENESYSRKNNELSNNIESLTEKIESIKTEHEEEINDLTDNHESIIEKLKDDHDKVTSSYKSEIEAIKENNILLSESLAALRENNDLMKKSMETQKQNAEIEIARLNKINQEIMSELEEKRKLSDKNTKLTAMNLDLSEQLELLKKKTMELENSRKNDYVIPLNNNVKSNNDYIKTMEYRKLKYAGMKDEGFRMNYPADFMNMDIETKKEIALDMAVLSSIKWGDDWNVECENKEMKAFLEDFRKQNQHIINERVNAFHEKNKTENKTENKENKTIENDEAFDAHYKVMMSMGVLNDLEHAKQIAETDDLMKRVIERFEKEQNQNNDIKELGEK